VRAWRTAAYDELAYGKPTMANRHMAKQCHIFLSFCGFDCKKNLSSAKLVESLEKNLR